MERKMAGITRVNLLYNVPPEPKRPARDGRPARPARPARPGRLAVAKSAFYENFVLHDERDPFIPGTNVSRLKLLHLAANATAAFNDEIEALEEGLRRWRDEQRKTKLLKPRGAARNRSSKPAVAARNAETAAA
jgi:hypothetical protein